MALRGEKRAWGLMILLAGPALVGCSSAGQKAQRNRETAQSWEATARLTEQLRERGAVPEPYARQVLEAAVQELERARRSSEKLPR
jgi:hypothetical protein